MPSPPHAPVRLELRGITKRFPGVVANDAIDLSVHEGEIHALLGENGAGKSTLVKIVDGLLQPDGGEIHWHGHPVRIDGPRSARALGIGMVFQHFSLFEAMSVAENIALGLTEVPPLAHLSSAITALASRYGLAIEADRVVHGLSVGERQRVEILRCLMQDARLLILDEPTSVLTPQEAQRLFDTLRRLAREGRSVLYISHKLHEIQTLCDSVTVLRGGRVVGRCEPGRATPASLARMMVGTDLRVPSRAPHTPGEVVLAVEGLDLPAGQRHGSALHDVNLRVHAGEVLGIAGIAGNGQGELLRALTGERLASHADIVRLGGVAVGRSWPRARRRLGLACVPEDRLGQGAVAPMRLTDNALLTAVDAQGLSRLGFINAPRRDRLAQHLVSTHDVRCAGIQATASSLSGGNLQKFITGRELDKRPRVLIAAQPTWGVDAGAAAAIHEALLGLAGSGTGVLILSQELDELLALCDRIAVMSGGRLGPAEPAADLDAERIGLRMAGAAPLHGLPAP